MAITRPSSKAGALLDAQLELWHHTLGYIKSMALKSTIDLRIPDAIHDHGSTATLTQIAAKVALHQSKLPYLRRLMRVLTVTGVFSVEHPEDGGGEHVYGLTPATRLLVSSTSTDVSPLLTVILGSVMVSPFLGLGEWFRHEEAAGPTLFKTTHGHDTWPFAGYDDAKFAKVFDDGNVADSTLTLDTHLVALLHLFTTMAPAGEVVERLFTHSVVDGHLKLWNHTFGFMKSMALKSALDLRIADSIHHHGGTATLSQIATQAALHPSKVTCLRRLMRVLTVIGIFTVKPPTDGAGGDDHVYVLTPESLLLVSSSPANVAPFLAYVLDCDIVSTFFGLGNWLQREQPDGPSLFEVANGKMPWDLAVCNPRLSAVFHDGMVADSNFVMDILVTECGDMFRGLSSMIDVAGGLGGAAQAIAKAFPNVACSVLDLPHVVANAPSPSGGTKVKFVAGDMFESIPPANAVFIKWVLHDWGDAECVKILRNCKEAIPPKDAGGRVIIVDMVVGAESSHVKHQETQVLFDLLMMSIKGIQRDEQEWKKIIFEAGFSDYKIIPALGVRSIIEAYP